MSTSYRTFLAASAVVVGCLGAAREAHATLGGDVASILADQKQLGGERRVEKLPAGERHALSLPSGILVDEYLSPAGSVYAIAWHGPRVPDLRALLGRYFAQLARRALHRRGGHHRVTMAGPDLVIQSSGHRRAFAGRAWVPSLVPPGIAADHAVEDRR